ncbi:unnamed protein product [Cuscuta epithymum]|uniref:Uncharacterized protein n=1 Tax=Cuscuta epithymum TaxID=186058 RepID=A0AAV0F4P0_9ASTE|nr:unnamed protein product [Cuscuta epithymum]
MPPKKEMKKGEEGDKKEQLFTYTLKIKLNCVCDGCRNKVFPVFRKHCGDNWELVSQSKTGSSVEWNVKVTNAKTNEKKLEGYLKEVKEGLQCEAKDIKSKENGDGKKSKTDGNGEGEKKSGNGDAKKEVVVKKDDANAGKEKSGGGGGGGPNYNDAFKHSAALAGPTKGPYATVHPDWLNQVMNTQYMIMKAVPHLFSDDNPFACAIL